MSNLTYDVQAPGLDEQIAKLATYDSRMRIHLVTAMSKSVLLVEGAGKENAPVFMGHMRRSISSKVNSNVGSEITGQVGSNLDSIYPSAMERGRQPGKMPPVEALMRWVELKLGVPEADVRGVAFVIARSIARKGIQGRFFLAKALAVSVERITGFFLEAADAILRDMKINGP
jgi:hypothetical protein